MAAQPAPGRLPSRVAWLRAAPPALPLALVVVYALCAFTTEALSLEALSRFGFCPAPFAPPCVQTLNKREKMLAKCEAETERYVASVFAYRTCLSIEMERAVREANATIQALRCAKDPTLCPPPDAPPVKGKKQKSQGKAPMSRQN